MAYSNNIYDLLADDSQKQEKQEKQPVQKKTPFEVPAQKKKQVVTKNTQLNDATPFEAPPEHISQKQKQQYPAKKDRQPKTAFKDSEKKMLGKGSWGDEQEAQLEAQPDGGEESAPVPVEEEIPMKSFADFLAEKASRKVQLDLTPRRAGEGVDDSQWKNVTLVQKEESVFFAGNKEKQKKDKVKERPQTIDIQQRFVSGREKEKRFEKGEGRKERPERTERPERGERSERPQNQRGERPSDKGKNQPRGNASARGRGAGKPNVTDTSAFPSL